jgi:hypothetical protein
MKSNQTNGKMLFPTGRTAIVALGLLAGMALGSQPIVAAEVTSPVVAQQQQAKGKVVDKSGEPLIGVTVQVVGQTGGTVTDIDGKYTIDAQKGAKLKFSYVGYKDQTIAYDGAPVNITMSEGEEMLQELVVVGYGTQKKESLTGAVTVVDSKAFQEKGGLSSPLQALQGTGTGRDDYT